MGLGNLQANRAHKMHKWRLIYFQRLILQGGLIKEIKLGQGRSFEINDSEIFQKLF